MARERLYLFDTTLRDGSAFFPSPRGAVERVDPHRGRDADRGGGCFVKCAALIPLPSCCPPPPTPPHHSLRSWGEGSGNAVRVAWANLVAPQAGRGEGRQP